MGICISRQRQRSRRAAGGGSGRPRSIIEQLESRTLLSAGDPESSFGTHGIVSTAFQSVGYNDGWASDAALTADGKIIVAGYYSPTAQPDHIVVARYADDGAPDNSFGQGGEAYPSPPSSITHYHAVCVTTDSAGSIYAGGWSGPWLSTGGNGRNSLILKLKPDGSVDTTFGDRGYAIKTIASSRSQVNSILINSAGQILVGGWVDAPTGSGGGGHALMLARFTSSGSLDTTFASGGVAIVDVSPGDDEIHSLRIDAQGRIVAAGCAGPDYVVARFDPHGASDTTFATLGRITGRFNDSTLFRDLAIDSAGRIIAAGAASSQGQNAFAIARFDAEGHLDSTFGQQGRTITAYTSAYETFPGELTSISLDAEGRIVGGGYFIASGTGGFALARYTTSGLLDETFGSSGLVFQANTGIGTKVLLNPAAEILLAGTGSNVVDPATGTATQKDGFRVARYQSAQTPRPTAVATAPAVSSAGAASYDFTVTYTGPTAIDTRTIGASNIRVLAPANVTTMPLDAYAVQSSGGTNGQPLVITYRITPPGGSWNHTRNGHYTVFMRELTVRDTADNYVAAGSIGQFDVNIPVPPPPAPSGLAATPVSFTRIELVWSDNSFDETSFTVERSRDGVHFSHLATIAPDSTRYTDTAVAPATKYYYRVRATNAGGESPWSSTAIAMTRSDKIPKLVGTYTARFTSSDGYSGKMIMKILSQKGNTITGRSYSGDLGGFDVKFAGKVDLNGRFSGKGKNERITLKSCSGTVSPNGKTISTSWSVVLMGIPISGTATYYRTGAKVPSSIPAKAPRLVGEYSGLTIESDGDRGAASLRITRQEGGHIWATGTTDDGSFALKGLVLPNGKFHIMGGNSRQQFDIYGLLKSGGTLIGYWYRTKEGQASQGNFSLKRE